MCVFVWCKSIYLQPVDVEKVPVKLFIHFGGCGNVCFYREVYRLVSYQWAALTALIRSIETNESVAGTDCKAFKGIHSVSFMLAISVKNRKLFSHLIHIIDKMRN